MNFQKKVPVTKLSSNHAHCAPKLALQGRINTVGKLASKRRIICEWPFLEMRHKYNRSLTEAKIISYQGISSIFGAIL